MARTVTEIQSALQDAYEEIDPSIDTIKGAVFDQFIDPQSQVWSSIEERQDRTDRLASADFTAAATTEELERMAATVGAGPSQGDVAVGYAFLGTRSRPRTGTTTSIPQGTLVGDDSLAYVYQTTEAAEIDGNYPENYYNPSKRTYEVMVPIEAVAVGGSYNLPPYRIRRIVATITGIDFVENRSRLAGGVDPGDAEDTKDRAESKLVGQEFASPNGIAAAIVAAFPAAASVAVITSANYELFRRATTKPGIDYYYSGEDETEDTMTYTAVGGEVSLSFEHNPVLSVTSVLVNGVLATYEVIADSDPGSMGSTEDTSYISFSTPLGAGAVVSVKYKYDALAENIAEVYAGSDQGIFETDIRVRRSFRRSPQITMSANADSGFNQFSLRTSIIEEISTFFETGTFGAIYYPKDFRDHIGSEVIGISGKPSVSLFQLYESALLDIEPIELAANETAEIDSTLISVDVQ